MHDPPSYHFWKTPPYAFDVRFSHRAQPSGSLLGPSGSTLFAAQAPAHHSAPSSAKQKACVCTYMCAHTCVHKYGKLASRIPWEDYVSSFTQSAGTSKHLPGGNGHHHDCVACHVSPSPTRTPVCGFCSGECQWAGRGLTSPSKLLVRNKRGVWSPPWLSPGFMQKSQLSPPSASHHSSLCPTCQKHPGRGAVHRR